MKKVLLSFATITALTTTSFANDINKEMFKQIQLLKAKIEALEKQMQKQNKAPKLDEKRIVKIEKKLKSNSKKIQKVKAHDAGDNIKWNVDFRTQVDNLNYKLANGKKLKNEAVMSNRLNLGMKFKADENSLFYGMLSYNKLYGDNSSNVNNNANFDWITNESATNDNELKVKEAYWLYSNDSFLGNEDISWTASIGRRPSTDGLGINYRADQKRKSALAHTVNVEFDGASARFNIDKLTGMTGSWAKVCMGRGLTNARLRFSMDGKPAYTKDSSSENIDMAGLIYVPYDDGQYSIHTNYARAWNLIGMKNGGSTFEDFGKIDLATIMLKTDGIGNGINDILDYTTVFASFAMSKTHPKEGMRMLGSNDSKTGHSIWLGVNAPCPLSPDDAKIGVEWNKGSKYWRSMTYGEDTMAGSKIAARGTAWEVYRHQKLTKALSLTMRYTNIKYDYTGSNGFFGELGAPTKVTGDNVKEAQNVTANIRYRF